MWLLKTECISPETSVLRICMALKEMRQTPYLWRAGLLNMKEKGMTTCYIMNRWLVMFLREGKVNVVQYWWCSIEGEHCPKVKGEQVITLQMAQQLKNENINVAPGQLFCRQRKAKFLLEKVTTLMIKINFNRLQRLTMNSLIVKHQGKSSNQLAIQLSADTHLWKL